MPRWRRCPPKPRGRGRRREADGAVAGRGCRRAPFAGRRNHARGLPARAFEYFVQHANPQNGLVADTSRTGSHASIAVVGFALSAYPVGVERGWMTRPEALQRCLPPCASSCTATRAASPDRRVARLLLPLPAHGQRHACVALRGLSDRHIAADGRRTHSGGLLHRSHRGRSRIA